jgi:hypothetical protein
MKTRIFVYLLVSAATLLFIPSASATWSGSRSLGKTPVVGIPSCAQLGPSEVMCVARSQSSTLMANEFSKSAWNGWTNLSGAVSSDPSCVADGLDNIACGVSTAANTLAVTLFNGKTWSSLNDSGGVIASSPSCALIHAGKVFCGARSVSGALTTSVFNGATWGKFSTQAASLVSAPACTSDGDGNVICEANAIVNGVTNSIANLFDGLKWQGFLTLNGYFIDKPFCLAPGEKGSVEGEVWCLALGGNDVMWVDAFNGNGWSGGDWSGWRQGITGLVYPKSASCAPISGGSVTCGFINVQDSLLYVNTWNGSSWSGYAKVGTKPLIAGPNCTTFAKGKAMCVVVGLNSQALSVTGP